jgi:putative ABC transport system permease protein
VNGLLYITWSHLRRSPGRTAILVLCTALSLFLPLAGALLVSAYERDLTARAIATPMLLGARGNRFDLVLTTLYFRDTRLETVPQAAADALRQDGTGVVIPLHLGYTARKRPVVGTSPEYYELRGLRPTQGTLPLLLGDACLGADVARDLGLAPGGALFSDPRDIYDIAAPPALKLNVVGVLARTGTADDGAVFVDVKTGWVLEGIAHGHQDPKRGVDPSLVLKAGEDKVTLSESMVEYHEVTPENIADFHFHGDPAKLPLAALLFVPDSPKAATMTKAKVNFDGRYQMVVPEVVVGDLVAFVFRVKRLFDALTLALGAITVVLTGLVLLLSARLRRREMQTLHRLGCSPGTVAALHASEIGFILVLGAAVAAVLLGATLWWSPDLGGLVTHP